MTNFQRVKNIILGILIILCSLIMMCYPTLGKWLFLLFIAFYTGISGLSQFIYYLSMGTHMVGGRVILYKSLILMDISALAFSVSVMPGQIVSIYLVIYYGFTGVVDILRATESKRLKAGSWRMKLVGGILCIAMAILSIVFIRSLNYSMLILCIGFIYSAIMRIISAFRKYSIVYIQ